jgi:SAM-dependent methyltransferase
MADDHNGIARLFKSVAIEKGGRFDVVLDFGCGAGRLVEAMHEMGVEVYGCDIASYLADDIKVPRDRFHQLHFSPYRLPFPDNYFDAVVSTSVLEHAQNTEELFLEIHRVLKPGGLSLHIYPGKWYLPSEPHIYVPLVNFFWPDVPKWWLWLWAAMGCRNEYQQSMSVREVTDRNAQYCKSGLIYLSTSRYGEISRRVFGDVSWPMGSFLQHADGGVARLWRISPFKRVIEYMSREFRMGLIAQRKAS